MHCPHCGTEDPDLETVEAAGHLISTCAASVIVRTERCAECNHFKSMHREKGRCNECNCQGYKPVPDRRKKCGAILGAQFKG